MANIFVNGFNSKHGGGKSILTNFLSLLSENPQEWVFHVLVPSESDYSEFISERINIIKLPRIFSNNLLFPVINHLVLPRLVKKHGCHLVFNLADVPIPTSAKQVFLFDWPYAVFLESPIWRMMDPVSWLTRKVKLVLFNRYLKHVTLMIAQSPTMKARLERHYRLTDVEVIPNAVSLDNLRGGSSRDFQLTSGLNLLYLTHYYPHKNLEVLIPLAKEILAHKKNIQIVTTIGPDQHPMAARFLQEVENQGLQGVINNIGPVPMKDVPALYAQTDGLLMPTLLESFSGTYVEAMFHGRPIFTSELDFATGVCGDAAYYFDPFDPRQILDRIIESQSDPVGRMRKIEAGKRVLDSLLTWEQAFEKYLLLFKQELQR